MTDIFVFTASGDAAQRHWRDTIHTAVDTRVVFEYFPAEQHSILEQISRVAEGFYCWGATPGESNIPTWERLAPGDHVLGYYDKHYRCVTSVIAKFHNRKFAERIWGYNDDGETWEYVYFLTKPHFIAVFWEEVRDIFGGIPQGFKHVADDRTKNIIQLYGSFENFVGERLTGSEAASTVADLSDLLNPEVSRTETIAEQEAKSPESSLDEELKRVESILSNESFFDATNLEDARERALRSLVIRQGQPAFRRKLLMAYGGQCAVTGFDSEYALEAAHIVPYQGEHTNDVTNGLLLRADIHTLFDCGKIGIHPNTKDVLLADSIMRSKYKYLLGKRIHLPVESDLHPSLEALAHHAETHGLI